MNGEKITNIDDKYVASAPLDTRNEILVELRAIRAILEQKP